MTLSSSSALRLQHLLLLPFLLASLSLAQFIPQSDAKARNLTVARSPADRGITVSYKSPDGACKTAYKTQKQYTGWVNIPGEYPTNLFFWFVEARERTESLTIWLNGGPGSSSMYGLFTAGGPCEIVEKGLDTYDTVAREWGWDRASNMLFIDQPNQVGLSYDTPTDGSLDLLQDEVFEPPRPLSSNYPEWALMNGTFFSGENNNTANTTETAAIAVWHVIQGFLTTFPQYQATRNTSVGINLFGESYGGRYGPIFAETFEEQNAKRLTGELPRNTTVEVHLKSIGIVNGCVDLETQTPYYPIFLANNTYGFKGIKADEANFYLQKYDSKTGCKELLRQCREAVAANDPDSDGDVDSVNSLCQKAENNCRDIQNVFSSTGRSYYDIAAPFADPFPAMTFLEYLNQQKTQQAIGSPVNFTLSNADVFFEFARTGDMARDGNIPRLATLLKKGIRIGFIYGDRDYICNWLGGEAVSLKVAQQASGDYATKFVNAGYAPIIVNDSYIGGVVRQYGNLSFSRIYQAGHNAAAYQPETAFQVFARIMLGTSISTGEDVNLSRYNTTGPANATHTDKLPSALKPTCYIRAFQSTCDDDAKKLAQNDDGVVINGVLYSTPKEWPTLTEKPTTTTQDSTATDTMKGVYTAETTPSNAAVALSVPTIPAVAIVVGLVALHGFP